MSDSRTHNYSQASSLSPDAALPEIRRVYLDGQADEAISRCRELLQRFPDNIPAQELLAQGLRPGPDPALALEPLQRLAQLQPGNHIRHADLAGLYYQLRRLPEAEAAARQALALNPLNPQAHNVLAMVFADSHHPEEAEFHYRQVLLLHEPLSPLCANMANVLRSMGRLDEAESFYRQALYLDPENVDALLAWVRMEEARNQLARSWELLEQAPAKFANNPSLRITRAALWRRDKEHAKAQVELDAAIERHPGIAQSPAYHYERGEVLDGLGRYDEAFSFFQKANQAVRAQGNRDYQAGHHQDMVRRLKTFFTRARVAPIRQQTEVDPLPPEMPSPIFIVGFPRSGTTLVEQMLSAHPNISAGDELSYIWRLTQLAPHLCGSSAPYPECFDNLLNPEQRRSLMKFRTFYVANVELRRILEQGKHRFTDKMPLNETNLGLIHLAFPEAPIVHLIRHPLDVVLSSFFHDLTHGGNCSYDLVTAAQHYALIFDLVQHYRQQLDLRYHAVRYEDLVDDPESHLRGLLDFVNEPWNDRCLAFHENQRYARTASYAQVKEKLYTRSRFRYRHYLQHLESIIPILTPAIERLGYTV